MARVFWIEDEADRLETVFEMLEDEVGIGNVQKFSTAAAARKSFARIKADAAPVLLDLYLPTGDPIPATERKRYDGPKVGLLLLGELQEYLGSNWPIFIVSGNISINIMEDLIEKHGIPLERIFTKPLNSPKPERLVELVTKLVIPTAGDPATPGTQTESGNLS